MSQSKDDIRVHVPQIEGLKRTKSESSCFDLHSNSSDDNLRPFADKCGICSKICQYRCRRCQTSFYCGRLHQIEHWTIHKHQCTKPTKLYVYKSPGSETAMITCTPQNKEDEHYEFRKGMIVRVNNDHEKLGGAQGIVVRALQPEKKHNGYVKVKIASKVFAVLAGSLTVLSSGPDTPPPPPLIPTPSPDLIETPNPTINPSRGKVETDLEAAEPSRRGIGYKPDTIDENTSSDIMTLVEMGFEIAQASQALKKCNGNVSSAANFLFSGEVVEDGEVESAEFLSAMFDNVEDGDEDSSILCSGDYQITGGWGEYFHVKGTRYYSMKENGIRFFISMHSNADNALLRQEVQLDVSDYFINCHFNPSVATAPVEATSTAVSSLSQTQGLPVDPAGILLSDKDKVAVLISYFELQPQVDAGSKMSDTEYYVAIYSSQKHIPPLISSSTLSISSSSHNNQTCDATAIEGDDVDEVLSVDHAEKLHQMTEMGVERDVALQALQRNYFNLSMAFDSLFGGNDDSENNENTDTISCRSPAPVTSSTYERFWTCKMCDHSCSYIDTTCSSCGCPRI